MAFDQKVQKIYSDLNTYSVSINDTTGQTTYTLQGYSTIQTVSDEEFLNTTNFVTVDELIATANVTQPNPRKPFNCNYDFSVSSNIKLKLPSLDTAPNFTLLDKINEFTTEVATINDDLIKALRQMNCCDLEDAYNKTLVPFFRWFADHKDSKYCSYDENAEQNCGPMFGGNTFPMMLYNVAETLLKVYLVVRPVACSIRPLPGHPWFLYDLDFLSFLRFILDFFDVYYNIVVTGKIMDPLINPVKDFRQKLEACLFGKPYQNDQNDQNDLNNYYSYALFTRELSKKITYLNKKLLKFKNELKKLNSKKLDIENTELFIYKNNESTDIPFELISNYNFKIDFISLIDQLYQIKTGDDTLKQSSFKQFVKKLDNIDLESIKTFCKNNVGSFVDTSSGITLKADFTNKEYFNYLKSFTFNNCDKFASDLYIQLELIIQDYKTTMDEISKLKEKKLVIMKSIDKLEKVLNTYSLENEALLTVPQQKLINYAQNKMANVSYNLCNCLVYTLLPELKVPISHKIIDFSYDSMKIFLNKKSFLLKTNDSQLLNLCYPKAKDNNQEKSIFYSENLLKTFDDEWNQVINNVINNTNMNIYQKLSKTTIDINLVPPFIKKYLELLDNVEGGSFYIIFDINTKNDSVPRVGESGDITITYPTRDWSIMPKYLKPLEYFAYKVKEITYIKSIDKNLYNLSVKLNNNVFNLDYKNWLATKDNIQAKLNTVKALIENPATATYQKPILKTYLQKATDFYNHLFNSYPNIDLINDPHDYRTQAYYNYSDSTLDLLSYGEIIDIYNAADKYIDQRKELINKNIQDLYLYFKLQKLKNDILSDYKDSSIGFDLVLEKPDIPCTCDGIICKIIQYFINILLNVLSRLVQLLINMLIEWFMKSFIGKLIMLIIAKIKCILMVLRYKDDLDTLESKVDQFIEALKGNIRLYVNPNICLYNAIDNVTPQTIDPNSVVNQIIDQTPPQLPNPDVTDTNPQNINFNNINIINPNQDTDTSNTNTDTPQDPTVISLTSNNSTFQGPIPGTVVQGQAADLVVSDGVKVGILNPNGFPILTFDCGNCSPCSICNDDNKAETIEFLKEYLNL